MRRGAKVEFVDMGQGILVVPIFPFEELFGADKTRRELVYQMIHEIQEERRREASED